MQRIYLPKINFSDTLILSEEWIYHQLTRVLRSRVWDAFVFFDGQNLTDYLYEITHIDSREVTLVKKETQEKKSENNIDINLYQARPNKLSKIEYIIQKWVEVGIANFYIYRSERSQELRISNAKQQRLEKIIKEAVEQSNRNLIPKLYMLDELDIKSVDGNNIYMHTSWENTMKIDDLQTSDMKPINIWVWPEWWFSDTESNNFDELGFKKLYLWDRVLRTETVWTTIAFLISQMFL